MWWYYLKARFGWMVGRQVTGYLKSRVFEFKKADCWVLKYPDGTYIPPHKDKVEDGYEMWRINLVLKKPKGGGVFTCEGGMNLWGRVMVFCASKNKHSVSRCVGTRYVLSIGFIKKEKGA